jgi:AraC-like DNA-binding protein
LRTRWREAFHSTAVRRTVSATIAPPAGITLYALSPPYQGAGTPSHAATLPARGSSAGTVLLVDVERPEAARATLPVLIPQLRRAHPDKPVVLRVDAEADAALTASTARLAGQLRARAVLRRGEPAADALRRALTDPVDLGGDVQEWLAQRGPALSPDLSHLARCIFGGAADEPDVTRLIRDAGGSERTARARFHRRGLPPPSGWHQAARGLCAALRLQRDPAVPLLRAALEMGYSDHSSLAHQLRRVFGVGAAEVRGALGWEWLLDRWLERARARVVTPAA